MNMLTTHKYLSLSALRTLLVCVLTAVVAMAQSQDLRPAPHVSRGTIDCYTGFKSKYVEPRAIYVWMPTGYSSGTRYDVIYMHDGQMLFDADITWNHQEWRADEVADSLIQAGSIRPCIIVGIDNSERYRIEEFTPDDMTEFLPWGRAVYDSLAAKGNDYLRFIVEEVKPFVDSHYSTNKGYKHTFTLGSSCGALIASYAMCKYPKVFGGAACMSTHSTFMSPANGLDNPVSAEAYVRYLKKHLPKANTHKLYYDCGDKTDDADYLATQKKLNDMLFSLGWDEQHLTYRFFPGHAHCEADWCSRLHVPLEFLLGK